MKLWFHCTLLTLFTLILFPLMSSGEGTRELQPDSVISSAGLYISNEIFGDYTRFGVINCEPNYRLCIHVKEAGESILFGLQTPLSYYTYQFNLRKPDGTIALSGNCPQAGQPGYIHYYHQAIVGPFPTWGGYTPLQYTVTNSADTGNYYFELSNMTTSQSVTFDLWDFQVVSGEHTPAIPEDMIFGRVWSQAWQVYSLLATSQVFNGDFFIYSDDGIVTKLDFQNARIGAVTIFCNPYGCYNTGNFLTDRKSVNTNTFLTFPEIADYRVFLNDPDTTLYPSGEYGEIVGIPEMIPDPAFPPCSGPQLILVNVNKPGNLDIALTFPYGFPATTVNLFSPVLPGINQIAWNGLDGQGNPVPDGTPVTITITFADGLTNLPIWDQETNPDGFIISLIRPVNPSVQTPETFWDDMDLTAYYLCPVAPQTSNLTGCTPGSIPGYPGCHPWGLNAPDCHNKMINTWWYGSSSTVTVTSVFTGTPDEPVGHGDSICGPGIVTLHATVPPSCTVDWYDAPSGGTLLLAGDTTFITPVLTVTTTFYAEARNDTTNCTSLAREPVVATILPAPVPTITGSDTACTGTFGHIYQTEPGKSNYKWWLSSGGFFTSPNGYPTITVTWIEPGNHTVFVHYVDTNGCPAGEPAAFRVIVLPFPDSAGPITGPSPVCVGSEALTYMVEPVAWAQSYTWSLPPGFTIASGAGTCIITVDIGPTATSGEIQVHGTNLCGDGIPSPPFPVEVIQPPATDAGPGDTICQGSAFTVTGATASGFSSLTWISSGTGILENAATLTPTYIPGNDETGAITLTLIAGHPPCHPDSSSMTLWIEPAAMAHAGPDLSSCSLSPVSLQDASAFLYQNLRWSTSGTGNFDDPTLLHPTYFPTPEDLSSGVVTMTLTAFATAPCTDESDTMQVTFSSLPEGDAGADADICEGNNYQVTGAVANNFSTIRWEHNGAGILEGNATLAPLYIPASGESGTVTLTLTIFGEEACSDSTLTKEMQIHIYALEVDAGYDQFVDSGAIVILAGMVEAGSGDYLISWEPAGWVADPAALKTITLPMISNTWFTLTATDRISGCTRSDSLWIQVSSPPPPPPEPDCLEVYNVITPNGDGVNDTWIITCIEQYPDNTVQIVNRWGNRIRIFDRYDNADQVWDGTNQRGEPVPDGTYYYILTIKNMEPKTGWIFVRGGSK
ncbi:MAG: gliding motility-associated C-terminal domain-containing protein [Bacteroidales bacterium]|nr:gliding motility-associated C-terminal domain-containing protein [Bacteroidales bacterium]